MPERGGYFPNERHVSCLKVPGKAPTTKRKGTLGSLSERTREWTRGKARTVRRGFFHEVPDRLPTRYFARFFP